MSPFRMQPLILQVKNAVEQAAPCDGSEINVHHFALVCLSLAAIVTTGCGVTSQAQNSTTATAIKSISPTSVVAGGPSFALLVSGTGFTTDSVVTVNNQVRATTFISATQLKAVILASDIGNPGPKPLSVFNVHSFVPAFDTAALSVQPSTSSPPPNSTLQITTAGLPAGAVGVSYSAALAAANGVPPYTWGIASGQLPPGLNLQASAGQISGTPSQAGTFAVTVQVTDSSGQSTSAGFSANIAPQSSPVVTGVSPSAGPTAGGTSVTITGSNFLTGATVSIGGNVTSSPAVLSSTQIRVLTPAHLAGNADVVVQNPNGEASTLNNGFVYNVPSPTVASVSPNSGPTAGGTRVTITGTNFLAGALILFGSAPATSVVVNSATQIQATTPAHAAGLAQVMVEDPGNVSANLASGFTYTSSTSGPPTISGVSPSSGPAGTQVTITGTNLTTATTVSFGTANAASTAFVSATQLDATVPTIATGAYNVTVTDPDPASATLTNGFTVTAAQAQSLLNGCIVVESNNAPSCSAPSGWTLAGAEGFGGGSTHMNSTLSGSVTTTKAHTGSSAMGGLYQSDGGVIADWIHETVFGPYNDIYLSYWDYEDPNALIPQELFVGIVSNGEQGTAPNTYQDTGWDWQNTPGQSDSCASMANVFEPLGSGGQGTFNYGNKLCINAGSWRQYEMWYHPNTVTGGVANKDGFIKLFVNGQLQSQVVNANLNGLRGSGTGNQTPTMQNPHSDAFIEVGGVITAFCDPGATVRANPFSACPNAAPTPFHRYIDDIIIMKK